MNNKQGNNSYTAPGFVYFNNQQNSSNPASQGDFIPFTESPPQHKQYNNFSPGHFSSPQTKFGNSPNFNNRNNNRFQNRFSGGYNYRGNQSNNSFNSPRQRNNFRNKNKSGNNDISQYLDLSCTDNPWEDLEKSESEDKSVPDDAALSNDDDGKTDNSSSSH